MDLKEAGPSNHWPDGGRATARFQPIVAPPPKAKLIKQYFSRAKRGVFCSPTGWPVASCA